MLTGLSETFNKLEGEGKTIVLVGKPDQIMGVIGITDKIRDECRSLVESLHKKGIKPERLTATGYGEIMPLVPNSNKKNRATNRRAEFVLEKTTKR